MVSPKLAMHFISKGARKMKNDVWVFYKDIEPEKAGEGVVRRVLAYSDDIMVVENTFSKDEITFARTMLIGSFFLGFVCLLYSFLAGK